MAKSIDIVNENDILKLLDEIYRTRRSAAE